MLAYLAPRRRTDDLNRLGPFALFDNDAKARSAVLLADPRWPAACHVRYLLGYLCVQEEVPLEHCLVSDELDGELFIRDQAVANLLNALHQPSLRLLRRDEIRLVIPLE